MRSHIPINEFQQALTRMSKFTIGSKEATALFAIGDGATVSEIAERTESTRAVTHIRLGILRSKGLVKSTERTNGVNIHRLTTLGLQVVLQTLNPE